MSLNVVTANDFASKVLESDKPVFVKFTASWCPPCRMVAPILSELAQEHPEITFVELDVDNDPDISSTYKVSGIPTMIVFEDGRETKRTTGAAPKRALEKFLA